MRRFTLFGSIFVLFSLAFVYALPTRADGVVVNTGSPDGLIATASRPSSTGKMEVENADDFVVTQATKITGGTFTGLIPTGVSLSDITSVTIEFYSRTSQNPNLVIHSPPFLGPGPGGYGGRVR